MVALLSIFIHAEYFLPLHLPDVFLAHRDTVQKENSHHFFFHVERRKILFSENKNKD
jgi:hypothetical protein